MSREHDIAMAVHTMGSCVDTLERIAEEPGWGEIIRQDHDDIDRVRARLGYLLARVNQRSSRAA
jgi:hypothetical protein